MGRALSVLLVLSTSAAWAQSADPKALPDDPAVAVARKAYNDRAYNKAARAFLALSQTYPTSTGLYRALGRARFWAKDAAGAAHAYSLYLKLAPQAPDAEKIEAELELAKKQAGQARIGVSKVALRALNTAEVRIKAGKFSGTDGALGAIETALNQGFIGPELTKIRARLVTILSEQSEAALARWWAPEQQVTAKTLRDLVAAWAQVSASKVLGDQAPSATPRAGLTGLSLLVEGKPIEAIDALAAVAPGDSRLRYAQALAMVRASRLDDALRVLDALVLQTDDPRITIVQGLVAARLGRGDAVEILKDGLLPER